MRFRETSEGPMGRGASKWMSRAFLHRVLTTRHCCRSRCHLAPQLWKPCDPCKSECVHDQDHIRHALGCYTPQLPKDWIEGQSPSGDAQIVRGDRSPTDPSFEQQFPESCFNRAGHVVRTEKAVDLNISLVSPGCTSEFIVDCEIACWHAYPTLLGAIPETWSTGKRASDADSF